MNQYSRICAEISLDAIEKNLELMMSKIGEDVQIIAVIKANAYGHGAVRIAKHIEPNARIFGFAVATASEALQLRASGVKKPVLLLGYVFPESYEELIEADVRFCIFEKESAELLSRKAVETGHDAIIHLAVDTGMGRIGLPDTEEGTDAAVRIAAFPGLKVEGMFTHFARADEPSKDPAYVQLDRYLAFEKMLRSKGLVIPLRHASNSAGIMRMPEANLDLVRAGITLYGLFPSDEVADEMRELKPVMKLISHVAYVKTVEPGTAVSYGGTWVADRETKIATIPVGYADGYPRTLSNKGYVLIRGRKVPILGRVCMDQMMVDVSEFKFIKSGEEVVLLGTQEGETITAEELGALSGRFNYELVSDISQRVPRRFTFEGVAVHEVDYLI